MAKPLHDLDETIMLFTEAMRKEGFTVTKTPDPISYMATFEVNDHTFDLYPNHIIGAGVGEVDLEGALRFVKNQPPTNARIKFKDRSVALIPVDREVLDEVSSINNVEVNGSYTPLDMRRDLVTSATGVFTLQHTSTGRVHKGGYFNKLTEVLEYLSAHFDKPRINFLPVELKFMDDVKPRRQVDVFKSRTERGTR